MHMAQEKPTSIRILQHPRKTAISPTLLFVIGFLAGILISILGFILYLNSSNEETDRIEKVESATSTENHEPIKQPVSSEHTATDDEPIQQPKDSDLTKLFRPAHVAPSPTIARSSPFESTNTLASTSKPEPATKATSNPKTNESKKAIHRPEKNTTAQPETEKKGNSIPLVEPAVNRKSTEIQ